MMEKNDLTFDVLSDTGNAVAAEFGLVYTLPEDLRETYKSFGVDLAEINGNNSGALPIPATFVIGTNGRIRLAHAEVDYRKRLTPEAIVQALNAAATP